jgi:hypothetical protein
MQSPNSNNWSGSFSPASKDEIRGRQASISGCIEWTLPGPAILKTEISNSSQKKYLAS